LFSIHRALKPAPIQYDPKGRLDYYQAPQCSNPLGGRVDGSVSVKYKSDW
jgi:hypothetical protein